MRLPRTEDLGALVEWEPPLGVLSVHLEIDPGDRAGGWRVALRDELDRVADEAKEEEDREKRGAISATAARVAERFAAEAPPSGRVQIGFVEVGPKPGREEWFAVQYPVVPSHVHYARKPHVRTLVDVLDAGRTRTVAAISAERVRLFEWRLGAIEEHVEHDLELFSPDWRERKGPSIRDPASAQGVTSAGRDQFDQRLEHNRMRFLKESGRRCSRELGEAARRELLAIGDPQLCEAFLSDWEPQPGRVSIDHHDVIAEPVQAIGERVAQTLRRIDGERDAELTERVLDAALAANGAGALGVSDTARALTRGQVEHLLIDAEREFGSEGLDDQIRGELEAVTPIPDGGLDEWIIHAAIRTSATVTTVHENTAARLAEHGGVGAILRY